jgi:hypothetical protein
MRLDIVFLFDVLPALSIERAKHAVEQIFMLS